MFKNKLLLVSPIIAFAVIFIFSLTLFPSVQPQPKNLPIAIVNEDEGVEIPDQPKMNMGQTIVDMIQENSKATTDQAPAMKWVIVKSLVDVQEGLDNQEYYAALVIPKDFSAKQATLQTPTATSPEVLIFINQGMNPVASTAAGQILNGVVDNMNNNVRTQILDGFDKQGATLTAKQAASLVTPITKKITNVNEVGANSANGNSPIYLFQPLWIASLAVATIIFISVNKLPIMNRKESLIIKIEQIVMGAIASLVVGFGLPWLADGMVGLQIPHYTETAVFLTITAFSFFLMISAVLSWLGFKSIAIFALMLFFGAPLLAMAPEMMSPFYQDWIYSWLPMRFMIQGLRELFFFGNGLTWSTSLSTLVSIGVVSMLVILASALKHRRIKEGEQN